MEKGKLIEFRLHGERRLAIAERPDGKKNWVVVEANGQSHSIPPKQISYEVAGESYKSSEIPKFLQEVETYIDPSSIELAWELLVEEAETVNPEEMALLLFSEQTPAQCYAAYILLSDDKLYFKQKGDRYEPRPIAQVGEIKHQQEVQKQKQQELENFLLRVRNRLAGEEVEWQPSDYNRLDVIEKLATYGEEASNRTQAMDTLAVLELPETPEAAFKLLMDLGIWSEHENLFLRRSQIPKHFSTKVLEVAQSCLQSPQPDPDTNRLDLTHLKVYTIDDESTKEIDDGLSIEFLEDNQQKIWVHIADPTRLLTPGDELDLDARRRTTTLYLPTGIIPMFPSELATGPMSLIQGQICSALSFGVILDESGGVVDYSIHASLIKPTYRLTYDDVDEMLQLQIKLEPEIHVLNQWAKQRFQWRQSQGSISIYMPESVIKVEGEEVKVEVLDDSPSRQLVAEMMIMAGEVGAKYGQKHDIPLPYRSQPQPELPPEAELILLPAGPVRSCAMRRCMPKSEMGIIPARHASLALETYVQITSPIRRYSDLLAHFQIKAHLRGEELPFSRDQMQEIVMSLVPAVKEASSVERCTNRYWGLEYLRRNSDEVWQALIIRWLKEEINLGLVLLEELGLELAMRFGRSVNVGDRIEVKVAHADPRKDEVIFQEVITTVAEAAAN
ncbi:MULTISPECIES: ribonuclease catalytic domain-containing protein [unclassified Okeania]|uniref:ribonuclease catalytic domain-containing protein n=1 Tax=unclassified Okeania TaxID=2634635 RepID=UPI0013BDA97B|nr:MULTISPECIES: ribonuclease R family protein [unclassified Okeania]NES76169.1 VacB/RNase II family 3'-5' exoribonuclease [Okeania sp. SIO1H4]NET15224.1 VacB/RNase II family 3'-5' exoribonuclease [Okeania sp. SIO1H6]NET19612.1 VacB/RNase II family 3'-5' exoribonuclease [Okeania sp. SIO1H5]NET93349.1 VacB/RNase II family 3'-5' exoribonuclease [Okeania sp. SIO1H2]